MKIILGLILCLHAATASVSISPAVRPQLSVEVLKGLNLQLSVLYSDAQSTVQLTDLACMSDGGGGGGGGLMDSC